MPQRTPRSCLTSAGPKKILACDGGGILGLISVEIPARLEDDLRQRTGRPDLVLGSYTDEPLAFKLKAVLNKALTEAAIAEVGAGHVPTCGGRIHQGDGQALGVVEREHGDTIATGQAALARVGRAFAGKHLGQAAPAWHLHGFA
jgi:hypothetical protein